MNELQIFKNTQFGQIRTTEVDGKIYFVASDMAKALKYQNTSKAINDHCKGVTKRYILTNGGKQLMNVIPEGDIYRLVANSELPAAQEFESWIFDEVLPSLRKTGTYSLKPKQPDELKQKEVEAKLNNSKARLAKTWIQIGDRTTIPEYKEIANAYAANTLAGERVLELPEAQRKTYSATDIGKQFNISKNMVGKIANQHNLKTAEYGKLFYDKSEYSDKQVETWRYYESVIPVFAKILGVEVIGL